MATLKPDDFQDYRMPRIRKQEDWEDVFEELFRRVNLIGRHLAAEASEPDEEDEEEKDWLTKATEHPVYGSKVVEMLQTIGEEVAQPGRLKSMIKGVFGKLAGGDEGAGGGGGGGAVTGKVVE